MKRSEIVQELLDSYCFQYGKNTNSEIVQKSRKLISNFKKEEENSMKRKLESEKENRNYLK